MAVVITYNPDIFSIYQTFYTTKQVDLIESLAWIINDEKSFGSSEEQSVLILRLAQFYFSVIQLINQTIDPNWTYLDWLTQEEYDIIISKLIIESVTPEIISVPGGTPTTITSPTNSQMTYSTVTNLAAGMTSVALAISSRPISIMITDSDNMVITSALEIDIVDTGGVYSLDIYTTSALNNVTISITY